MPKQLKKSDFLEHTLETNVSKEDMIDHLKKEGFEFIPSYVDYLIDHFEAQNKIVVNEDGTFCRKGKKVASTKEAYRVSADEDGNLYLEKAEVTGLLSEDQKESGWATTENAAIKKQTQTIFAEYKRATSEVKELAGTDPVEVELDA